MIQPQPRHPSPSHPQPPDPVDGDQSIASTTALSTPKDHIVGADGIRALACLWVFACHVIAVNGTLPRDHPWLRWLAAGYMGVPVFFVLSGFLLSLPFWKAYAKKAPMPSLKAYASRRLGRIVPEFYACVLIMAALSGSLTNQQGLWQTLSCLTFTNTFFPATYLPPWDEPLWSIGIEMQFYLLWPLAAWGLFRMPTRWSARLYIIALIGAIALVQYEFVSAAPAIEHWVGNKHLFNARAFSTGRNSLMFFAHFLLGVIAADFYSWQMNMPCEGHKKTGGSPAAGGRCAVISSGTGSYTRPDQVNRAKATRGIRIFGVFMFPTRQNDTRTVCLSPPTPARRKRANRYDLLTAAAVLLLIIPLATTAFELPHIAYMRYSWPTFGLLVAAVLVCLPRSSIAGSCLDTKPFRSTAELSYGLYMWHIPVLYGVHRFWPAAAISGSGEVGVSGGIGVVAYGLVSLAFTWIIAAISYRLIGRPAIQWVRRQSRSPRDPAGPLPLFA